MISIILTKHFRTHLLTWTYVLLRALKPSVPYLPILWLYFIESVEISKQIHLRKNPSQLEEILLQDSACLVVLGISHMTSMTSPTRPDWRKHQFLNSIQKVKALELGSVNFAMQGFLSCSWNEHTSRSKTNLSHVINTLMFQILASLSLRS